MTRKPSKAAKAAKKPAPKAKPSASAKKAAAPKPKPKLKLKPKKPEKPLPQKKAAAPAPAPKAKPAKGAAPRGAPAKAAKPAPKPKGKEPKAAGSAASKKKAVLTPLGVAKPGLGHKWSCFNCGAKFYDLGKPFPVCPKCAADQRDRPAVVAEPSPSPPAPKRPAMAPMSRFLDDDEVAAPEPDEFGGVASPDAEVEEPEAAEIDIESLDEPAALGTEGDFGGEAEEE